MTKTVLILMFFILFQSCNKNKEYLHNKEISISIENKEMLNDNSLLVKLNFTNTTKTNFLIPITSNYRLENRRTFNPIFSNIVTSDFTNINNGNYKIDFLINDFNEKILFKGVSHDAFKMAILKNYESYSNSLLFLPKETKCSVYITFNNYTNCKSIKNCNAIFQNKHTKILFDEYDKNVIKTIDSLVKKNNLDYKIYTNKIFLLDSLYINSNRY